MEFLEYPSKMWVFGDAADERTAVSSHLKAEFVKSAMRGIEPSKRRFISYFEWIRL
jgi:hypothetical protein